MKTIDAAGTVRYYNENNQLHRTDGPAIEFSNGNKYWYINDEELTELEFNLSKYQPINDFSEGF